MTRDALALYEAALGQLPPLTRFVFLLNRVDDLSYRQIADRLGIETRAVECCMAEALAMIATFVDGSTPLRWRRKPLALAETDLRQRHRAYCERRLHLLGIRIAWDDDGDDDQTVGQIMLRAMPPSLRETLALQRDHPTCEQMATRMNISRWGVRWRLLVVAAYFTLKPRAFEDWLYSMASRHLWSS